MKNNVQEDRNTEESSDAYYGFLYGDEQEETVAAEALLTRSGVKYQKVSLPDTPQPGMNFVSPTFVTREGTFRGLEAIEAYVGWFVNDPDYHPSVLAR
jgi:hypothetical protein